MQEEVASFGPLPRLPWTFAPVEVAAALCSEPGFVFFDTATPAIEGVSIIATNPTEVLRGSIWEDRHIDALRRAAGALVTGGLFGSVDFNGRFVFGVYPQVAVFRHRDAVWMGNLAEPAGERNGARFSIGTFEPKTTRPDFVRAVLRAKDYIAAGDIYQVCLAYRFEAPASGCPWAFYEALRHHSPAPLAAYINLDDRVVASASPETFLRMEGRRILTRPIKGTRPRSAEPASDIALATELRTSAKENAELTMITDLERNDLGRVCEFGSIRVREQNVLERFAQVHHLVSTIEGTLRAGVGHLDALRACYPGGSISGAPKKRALEIIAELEPHPRGLYTGAMGYLGVGGVSQFNIAIRTAVFESGKATFHTGAGIVADSDPESEWEETRTKASGLLAAATACRSDP